MKHRLSLIVAAAAAPILATMLVPFAAQASPPVLSGPDSSWSTTGAVADPHVQAACAVDPDNPTPITEAVCPSFPITLDASSTHPLHYLDVHLEMTSVAAGKTIEDYDIYLYDAAGNEVGLSASAVGTREVIAVNMIPDGDYTITVVPYTNLPDSSFTLTARYRTTSS